MKILVAVKQVAAAAARKAHLDAMAAVEEAEAAAMAAIAEKIAPELTALAGAQSARGDG